MLLLPSASSAISVHSRSKRSIARHPAGHLSGQILCEPTGRECGWDSKLCQCLACCTPISTLPCNQHGIFLRVNLSRWQLDDLLLLFMHCLVCMYAAGNHPASSDQLHWCFIRQYAAVLFMRSCIPASEASASCMTLPPSSPRSSPGS